MVGIVAVLMAFLLPSVRATRERAQRALCASRLRVLAAAAIQYGTENRGRLPRGNRDADDGTEHCIWVSHDTYKVLVRFVGGRLPERPPGQNGVGDPSLACPNLVGNDSNPLPRNGPMGWQLGYNYLGDHKTLEVNNRWPVPSPVRLTDRGSLPLFSDLNDWSPEERWTIVPHQRSGGGGFFFGRDGGREPNVYGAAGGNVAFLDGSVRWKAGGRLTANPANRYFQRAGELLLYYTAGGPGIIDYEGHSGLW